MHDWHTIDLYNIFVFVQNLYVSSPVWKDSETRKYMQVINGVKIKEAIHRVLYTQFTASDKRFQFAASARIHVDGKVYNDARIKLFGRRLQQGTQHCHWYIEI